MVANLKEVFAKFSDENVCRQYLVNQRWNGKPVCPYCGSEKSYIIEGGRRFKCGNSQCYKKYSVTVGTIFHASNIPLTLWFPAMYIISAHKKGISSVQLAKDLGVTQKSAWFMLHRIRESLKDNNPEMLSGVVESDETYMSRKYASDYKGLEQDKIDYYLTHTKESKGAVLGIGDRKTGKIRVMAFDSNKGDNIIPALKANINEGAILHTDESNMYNAVNTYYNRESVKHSAKEWVKKSNFSGYVSTNRVENFWSVMRRGIYGIYHQISFKHLQRYCDEFSYRYNTRDLKDGERFAVTFSNISRPLPYKKLVYGQSQENKA
jgi:transposase-like protein